MKKKQARRFAVGYESGLKPPDAVTVYGYRHFPAEKFPAYRDGDCCTSMTKAEARKAMGKVASQGWCVYELVPVELPELFEVSIERMMSCGGMRCSRCCWIIPVYADYFCDPATGVGVGCCCAVWCAECQGDSLAVDSPHYRGVANRAAMDRSHESMILLNGGPGVP